MTNARGIKTVGKPLVIEIDGIICNIATMMK